MCRKCELTHPLNVRCPLICKICRVFGDHISCDCPEKCTICLSGNVEGGFHRTINHKCESCGELGQHGKWLCPNGYNGDTCDLCDMNTHHWRSCSEKCTMCTGHHKNIDHKCYMCGEVGHHPVWKCPQRCFYHKGYPHPNGVCEMSRG